MGICGTVLYYAVRCGGVLRCAQPLHRSAVVLTVSDLIYMEEVPSFEYVRD